MNFKKLGFRLDPSLATLSKLIARLNVLLCQFLYYRAPGTLFFKNIRANQRLKILKAGI